MGYVVHAMQGFDYELARTSLDIPDLHRVEAMVAVGKPGSREILPGELRERELPNGRKKLDEVVCEGPFSF